MKIEYDPKCVDGGREGMTENLGHDYDALRAELAEAVTALRRIAKIDFPSMSSDGAWVAKTLFCNDMITAFQVREARAIVARFDAQRGKA